MNVEDFLPSYPNIYKSEYDLLNLDPVEETFENAIFRKKEFYDNKLSVNEPFPKEKGILTKYQNTIAKYFSSHTPYDRLLLVHFMGSGKTCSAIGAIEQIISEGSNFKGALIFAKGDTILRNFRRELVEKCTAGKYIPQNYAELTELEKTHRINKITKFYETHTFMTFAKKLRGMSDKDIINEYSNHIVVMDEVHNMKPQDQEGDEVIETYKQFHRFLHIIKNSKVLLLSGTPMKDGAEEIASVGNLLLPLDNQFPQGDLFLQEYMDKKGKEMYTMKPEKIPEFKEKFKGKISFLKETEADTPKEYITTVPQGYGDLQHFIINPLNMSEFQSKNYLSVFTKEKGGPDSKSSGFYLNSREATLFIYPDGSFGKKGFETYVIKKKDSYALSKELKSALDGKTSEEKLKNLQKYSTIYADTISRILNTKGNCFVYSSLVQGSGAILFSLILDFFGYSKASGSENTPGKRYALLTGITQTDKQTTRLNARFNKKDNMHGDIIQVIIGSKAVSEGFSFNNVIFEAILTPHWNYSETAQALARGIRLGSHNDLIKAGINPTVKISQPVAIPLKDGKPSPKYSVDLIMYQTSEDKDITIRGILRLLMEIAFDCALNYLKNHTNGVDGSRECDYLSCNYTCDGIPDDLLTHDIPDNELDYSTYQLYYSNPRLSTLRRKIEHIIRENKRTDLASIISSLKNQFSEEEIINSLYIINNLSKSGKFDYRTYRKIYSRTPTQKIIYIIEDMFKKEFFISFQNVLDRLRSEIDVTVFELLNALNNIITNSVTMTDRYGLPVYLRESGNIYFLVDTLSIQPNFFSVFYSQYPTITSGIEFDKIISAFSQDIIPSVINSLCSNPSADIQSLRKLPNEIQELFIEASLIAESRDIKTNAELRKKILKMYAGYIKFYEGIMISTLRQLEGIVRCCPENGDIADWSECNKEFLLEIEEKENKLREEKKTVNPYGITGKHNSENDAFCIVDYLQEKEVKENLSKKRTSAIVDKRLNYVGKVCGAGGWKLPELMKIMVKRLKVNPPSDYTKYAKTPVDELRGIISSDPKIMEIYTPEELTEADKDELIRALYWGTTKASGGNRGIKPICQRMKEFFDEKGLLEKDNKCGVQGKRQSMVAKEKKRKPYTIINIESRSPNFSAYVKDISRIMGECFNAKYRPSSDDNTWVLIMSRKKLVGCLMLDKQNVIWNVCVAKNYRRSGIAREAMSQAVSYICQLRKKQPQLRVDASNTNKDNLIHMYQGFGFSIDKIDENFVYMSHPCNIKDVATNLRKSI